MDQDKKAKMAGAQAVRRTDQLEGRRPPPNGSAYHAAMNYKMSLFAGLQLQFGHFLIVLVEAKSTLDPAMTFSN